MKMCRQCGLLKCEDINTSCQQQMSYLSDKNRKSQLVNTRCYRLRRSTPESNENNNTMTCLIKHEVGVQQLCGECLRGDVGLDGYLNSNNSCSKCVSEAATLASSRVASVASTTCIYCDEGSGMDTKCCSRTIVHVTCVKSEVTCRNRHSVDDLHVEDHRQELSMLTVLLALLAIAKRKCLLLSSPLARSNLSALGLLCGMFVCLLSPTAAQHLSPQNKDVTVRSEIVCPSMDIRNSVQNFERLRNCTVVEGFVQILLMDHADEHNYTNISFPNLREITGYLLLYRANGLRSIGAIFPNLAVIRGNTLFFNYALISYEMLHLQEIGLHSLTDIVRGSVRFEKNPLLCYVDTIDWDLIAKTGKNEHFIKGNRMKNECPMCPSTIDNTTCPTGEISGQYHCWNRHHCQKACPKECPRACDDKGVCCHKNCLGGCTVGGSQNADNCFVCKDVKMGRMCINKCVQGFYEYLNRRCVTEEECYKMIVPNDDGGTAKGTSWKPFDDKSCILECPSGYEEKPDNFGRMKCVTCEGPCRKECLGANIDSIASAQKLRGCTYIKGSLEIQIAGGKNIVKELEENLNMIEEIAGYLKIVRSYPLVSLNFLKKLRIIHGTHEQESGKYSLVVLDNQNLQELWDWDKRSEKLQIRSGRIFFHFNPKLCLYKIKQLTQVVGLHPAYTDQEVAANSNGDKVPCNVTNLKVQVEKTSAHIVIISWEQFKHYDPRSLLGYVLYTIEAPIANLTLYDGRDACGSDGWMVEDVSPEQTTQILNPLKPYTQYAYYVKTYMIATEDTGAQSEIQYFTTDPYVPSVPQNLKVQSNSSTTLVIKWQPPLTPNGNITHYKILITKESEEQIFLGERNYCLEPISITDKKPLRPVHEEDDKTTPTPNSCSCEDKTENTLQQEEIDQKMWSIHFEDVLHNQIYVKRQNDSGPRRRRSIAGNEGNFNSGSMFKDSSSMNPFSSNVTSDPNTFERIVWNSNIAVITGLQHYSQYTVRVKACRELMKNEKESETEYCGTTSIESEYTLQLEGADTITEIHVDISNQSRSSVQLQWDEPSQPNGIIVNYQIEYKLMDIENYKPTVVCLTRHQYRVVFHGSYTLDLVPGNYSVKVRATSLAGYGAYSPTKYFVIKEPSTSSAMEWLLGCLLGLFGVLVVCFLIFYLRRKYAPGIPNKTLFATVNPEYMCTVYVPDEWEVSRDKIKLIKELGQGSFGMVYEGIGYGISEGQNEIPCAIKTVGEHATDRERSEFLNEASVMKAFNTHHVVQLLGVVSEGQPVLVVMELMTNGDLKTYLRLHRPDTGGDHSMQPPSLKRILQMAIEIADGMAYLAAKKFVHRDLAARNCMVAGDLTVKIGDFGMTRDIYETDYYRKGTKGLLPVRWMAPESLKDGVFTSRSDVWSYGVVLWEMATLASQPYQGLSNDQVLRYVIDGGVMERPENCPDRLYELMRLCWQHKPLARPPFLDLVTILLADVPTDFNHVSFYHSKEGCEVRAHLAEVPTAAEDDPCTPLRITRDIEDFSLGGSDLDDEEEPFDVTTHSPSTSYSHRFNPNKNVVAGQQSLLLGNDQVAVSLSSNGNKLGNGSAVTSPTTANGWVVNHQNGTDNTSASQKTTEC